MPNAQVCMFCRYRRTQAPCSHANSTERERLAPTGLPGALVAQHKPAPHKEMSTLAR